MPSIRNHNEVMTGIFLILVALLGFYLTAPLGKGSTASLGPGFVPNLLAGVQLIIGLVMVVHGFVKAGESPEPWHLRPLVLVTGSVAFFAATIQSMGLVIAITGLVLISCAANRGTTWREALVLAIGSVVVTTLLFVKALGLVMPLWPAALWS